MMGVRAILTFRHLILGIVTAMAFAGTFAPAAGLARDRSQTLRLAPLQIMCIRAPCPWGEMAIRPVDATDSPHPLYRGPLPRLQAKPADAAAIRRAWRQRACVIVRGSVERSGAGEGASLRVSSILRRC